MRRNSEFDFFKLFRFQDVPGVHASCMNFEKNQSLSNEEDTLDAFVSMGGQPDGEGFIDAQKLIRIIKDEFEMTIDIEKLINDIDEDGSGEIEYDEFRNLLSSSD